RLARKIPVPYLISPHGMLVKKLIKRRNRFIKSMWIRIIEKTNLERASAIHATSAFEAEELERVGLQLPPIITIPNGGDEIERLSAREVSTDVKGVSTEQPVILFLGRISWIKGLDRLLKAFAVRQLGKLAIVGPDDENLTPHLFQLAHELQITDRISILPRIVSGSDKEHLYQSASVFVLPSHSENFGLSAVEAMQRGVPVVVTPEVGAAEIVRQSRGGLVTPGDPEPLSAAICQLATDLPLARSMGQAGKRHVMLHHSWHQIAARMESLYESL